MQKGISFARPGFDPGALALMEPRSASELSRRCELLRKTSVRREMKVEGKVEIPETLVEGVVDSHQSTVVRSFQPCEVGLVVSLLITI